ncbi:hypothetical protein D7V88_24480 [Corallococcus terminator]|uniref:Uncharacterized protein n=1 Tax=Corallococcus terminator TaxID=2316733 RepID=A0A3A8IIN1_9BACT|nr:hypothetical protein D7V88_24480 [Corallococcus terminator]
MGLSTSQVFAVSGQSALLVQVRTHTFAVGWQSSKARQSASWVHVPSSKPPSAPASKPPSIPASRPASAPASIPASKPASAPASRPASIPASRPALLPASMSTSLSRVEQPTITTIIHPSVQSLILFPPEVCVRRSCRDCHHNPTVEEPTGLERSTTALREPRTPGPCGSRPFQRGTLGVAGRCRGGAWRRQPW